MSELYTIEDLVRLSGMDIIAVRHYLNMGIIVPARKSVGDSSGRQYFDESNLKRLKTIKKIKRRGGVTMDEIARMLQKDF